MPSREELLQSIRPDMILTEAFFLRIYGYEISYPGFAAVALNKLEGIYILYARPGEMHPRDRYEAAVADADACREEGVREAAHWYVGQIQKTQERRVNRKLAGNREPIYQCIGLPKDW